MKSLPEQGQLATIVGQERACGGAVCNSGVVLKTLDPSFEVRAFGKAGPEGAVVSEFSTKGRDESDLFNDRRIRRIPEVEE